MVRDRQVELGVAFEPSEGSSLAFTPLYLDRFVAVVPGDSALAQCAEIDWEEPCWNSRSSPCNGLPLCG